MKHARIDYDRFQDPIGAIPTDEPVFILRGQDKHAAAAVAYYAMRLAKDPDVDVQLAATVLKWAREMQDWSVKKTPDTPPAYLRSG